VSQLPGSLSAFFSRSKVTSAASSGEDNSAAITPPAAAESKPRVANFDVNCPSHSLRMDTLLFPAGSDLLATFAARPEVILAIGDRRRAFSDDLGFEIGDDGFNLALL